MTITIDDYLGLIAKMRPEDWHPIDTDGKPIEDWGQVGLDYEPPKDWCRVELYNKRIHLLGEIKDGKEEIKLELKKGFDYIYSGLLGIGDRRKITSVIYYGTLNYDQINEEWKYILPIDKNHMAEEGDSRLKINFDDVLHRIQEYRSKTRERNEAVIRKLLKQPK
jgi:hypothetical protein